jgi:hypothetical protein
MPATLSKWGEMNKGRIPRLISGSSEVRQRGGFGFERGDGFDEKKG